MYDVGVWGRWLSMTGKLERTVKSVRLGADVIDKINDKAGRRGFSSFVRKAVEARLGSQDETVFTEEEHATVKGLTRQLQAVGTLLNQVTIRVHSLFGAQPENPAGVEMADLRKQIDTVESVSAQVRSVVGEAQSFLASKGERKSK